ncbi:MAG TPA: COP23 domain-containing protein [Oculatellaceae cyanobacterium]
MKFRLFNWVGILATAATINWGAMPVLSQTQANQVTFLCRQVLDPASGEKIPAILAWVPERKAHIIIVGWKSDYFYNWNREKHCQEATRKFQAAYNDGRLNYLKSGEINIYPVVCAVKDEAEQCNSNNLLFIIKIHDNPNFVLKNLFTNIASDFVCIYPPPPPEQQTYISVNYILQKAPIISEEAINSN